MFQIQASLSCIELALLEPEFGASRNEIDKHVDYFALSLSLH
jgi:hypothetical protein